MLSPVLTALNSPHGSFDLGSGSRSVSGSSSDFGLGLEQPFSYKGFVMLATVDGEGHCSKLQVVVGVQHMTCTEHGCMQIFSPAAQGAEQ